MTHPQAANANGGQAPIALAPNQMVKSVTLVGGLIGLFGGSPRESLNRVIRQANDHGYRVVQIMPAGGGNILRTILSLILLALTLLLYTRTGGYYILLEKVGEPPITRGYGDSPSSPSQVDVSQNLDL